MLFYLSSIDKYAQIFRVLKLLKFPLPLGEVFSTKKLFFSALAHEIMSLLL